MRRRSATGLIDRLGVAGDAGFRAGLQAGAFLAERIDDATDPRQARRKQADRLIEVVEAQIMSARTLGAIAGLALTALLGHGAAAQGLCGPLTRLLSHPPEGFVASRLQAEGPQRWTTRPVTPNASCEAWESRAGDAAALSCTINDRAPPEQVSAFYRTNVESIDRCLAAFGRWERRATPVALEDLRGTETIWVQDTDNQRFKVSLTDYLRTATSSFYNSFTVEYLKY